jgi:hypothetical protein
VVPTPPRLSGPPGWDIRWHLETYSQVTAQDFRRIALSLPEVAEEAHLGHPDFRVKNRIFATLGYPAPGWGMIKLTLEQQEWLVRADPETFTRVSGAWGRAGCTNVKLRSAHKGMVRDALVTAWRNRAPKRLAKQLPHH